MATTGNALLALLAEKYLAWCKANGRTSIEATAWKDILDPRDYQEAVNEGYWGAPGSVTGIDYGGSKFTGVRGDSNEGGVGGDFKYTLWKDGVVIATQNGPANFDTVAFAKAHGVAI